VPSSGREAGFSLLEVLVAFTILAMSLAVAFRIFAGGLGNIATSEDYARAVTLAESRLAAVGVSEPLQSGVSYGRWDEEYEWRIAAAPYEPWGEDVAPTDDVQAFLVAVDVDWMREGRQHRVTLSSVRLVTSPEGEGDG